jgi:hypothetical protein
MMFRKLFLLCLPAVLLCLAAQAQPKTIVLDTLREPIGKRIKTWAKAQSFKPYALRIGTDLSYWLHGAVSAPFGRNSLSENLKNFYANTTRFEMTSDVAFNRNKHFLIADMGYSSTARERNAEDNLRNISYRNTGTYWRIGFDYNLLHKTFTDRKNALLLGLRYARANFSQEAHYTAISTPWGFNGTPASPLFSEILSDRLNYRWLEMITGLRVAVWRELYLGYTFRVKFAGQAIAADRLLPNEIPGFGTVRSDMKLSFSYHIYYRLPLVKNL